MLEKKKELGKRCSSLEEEARLAAGIKEEAHRLEQRCQQLQAANTALKKQLKPLQEGHLQATALTEQVNVWSRPLTAFASRMRYSCHAESKMHT